MEPALAWLDFNATERERTQCVRASCERELKRLSSSVYRAALWLHGICLYSGSREDYHRDLDAIYRRGDCGQREELAAAERKNLFLHGILHLVQNDDI